MVNGGRQGSSARLTGYVALQSRPDLSAMVQRFQIADVARGYPADSFGQLWSHTLNTTIRLFPSQKRH